MKPGGDLRLHRFSSPTETVKATSTENNRPRPSRPPTLMLKTDIAANRHWDRNLPHDSAGCILVESS
ncbi:hypothetical protein MHYP_G00344200 [Metynnis hypsauchen]